LCIIPSRMKELEAYLEYIYELCEKIYPANDDYELWNIDIRPGNIVDNEDVSQEILFLEFPYFYPQPLLFTMLLINNFQKMPKI